MPPKLSISPVFNVSNLPPYHDTFSPPTITSSTIASARVPRAPSVSSISNDVIMDIVDDEFVTTSDGGFQRFLVCGKNCSFTDDTWLNEDELRQLAPKFLKNYLLKNSLELSSFHLGEMIEKIFNILKILG